MDLAIQVLGEYAMELVVTETVVYIRLLWPPGPLCLNILACLGHMDELVSPGWFAMPDEVFFG